MRGFFVGLLHVALVAACSGPSPRRASERMPTNRIQDVLAAHNDSLLALPGVVGTAIGICDGSPCIRIFVADAASAQRRRLPDRLEGYLVRVEVQPPPRALPGDD